MVYNAKNRFSSGIVTPTWVVIFVIQFMTDEWNVNILHIYNETVFFSSWTLLYISETTLITKWELPLRSSRVIRPSNNRHNKIKLKQISCRSERHLYHLFFIFTFSALFYYFQENVKKTLLILIWRYKIWWINNHIFFLFIVYCMLHLTVSDNMSSRS